MKGTDESWDRLPGCLVPFWWRAFFRKYALLLQEDGFSGPVVAQMVLRIFLLVLGQAGWAMDEILYPRWRRVKCNGPLFIIGHQRSGTTFLHRMLAEDHNAHALTLQEMIFPAVTLQKGLNVIAALDDFVDNPLRSAFRGLQDRLFGPLDDIHRVRFDEIEEDEFALWTVFSSAMCANDAPGTADHPAMENLRQFHTWETKRQIRALNWYRACILKKLYRDVARHAPGTAWAVSKNPAFTHKIPQLMKVFPTARFIYLLRNPLETIPSRLSLIQEIWTRRFPTFQGMKPPHVELILADSIRTYLSAERDLPRLPPQTHMTVLYRDILRAPQAVVDRIYRTFRLPGPDRNVTEALENFQPKEWKHHYSLETFGLDEVMIRRKLAPLFERFEAVL